MSNEAINEVKECMELSGKLFEEAIEAVTTGDDKVIDKMTRDKNKIRKINRQCSKAHFGRVKNKKCSKAMSGDYTEILQNIGRITDNCVENIYDARVKIHFATDIIGLKSSLNMDSCFFFGINIYDMWNNRYC